MNVQDVIVVVVLGGALIPLLRFIYRYHRFSPWETDPIGRTLMMQKISLVVLLSFVLLARVWPAFAEWPVRLWLSYAVFLVMVILFWRMDIELEKVQKGNDFDRFKNWRQRTAIYRASRRECREERRVVRRASRRKSKFEGIYKRFR